METGTPASVSMFRLSTNSFSSYLLIICNENKIHDKKFYFCIRSIYFCNDVVEMERL